MLIIVEGKDWIKKKKHISQRENKMPFRKLYYFYFQTKED